MILANIKLLCEKKHISISTLEKTLGFGNGTIGRWETCSPTIDKLQAVAKFFKVKVDRLLKAPEERQ